MADPYNLWIAVNGDTTRSKQANLIMNRLFELVGSFPRRKLIVDLFRLVHVKLA